MFSITNRDIQKDIIAGVVITSLIFASALYLPVIGFISVLFLPLPLCYYRYKLGRTSGEIILATSFTVMTILAGAFSFDLVIFAELLILGFTLGEMMNLELSIEKTVLYPCVTVIGSALAGILLYSMFSHSNISSEVNAYIKQNLELTIDMYRQMGVPNETVRAFSDSLEHIQYMLVRMIPGITIMSVLFVTWFNLLMAKSLAKMKGFKYPDFGDLTLWKSPEYLVWASIAGCIILLIPGTSFKMFGLNVGIILILIYFFHGISIVSFYFEKKKFPRFLRWILYGLIGIQQLFSGAAGNCAHIHRQP